MNKKAQKKLNDILIEHGYSHKKTKEVIKRYDKKVDQLYKLGQIDFRKEDPNGEVVETQEIAEIVLDEIEDSEIERILQIEKLRLESQNNKIIKDIQNDIRNLSNIETELKEIKEENKKYINIFDFLAGIFNNTKTMKNIIIFWFILTILSIISSIYTAIKINNLLSYTRW